MKAFKIFIFLFSVTIFGQSITISGTVKSNGEALPFANVYLTPSKKGTISDENGFYSISNVNAGSYIIYASFSGYTKVKKQLVVVDNLEVNFNLIENSTLDEIVVPGTLKAVSRLESPVPVEVYTPAFFKKNPTPNIFEALQNVTPNITMP